MPEHCLKKRPTLVVLASTYPRWSGDYEPGFVHELAKRLTDRFQVIAVVPRSPGAMTREVLDGVQVIRYRYAPRYFETLVNDGGIVTNIRRYPWKVILLPSFFLAQLWRVWRLARLNQIDAIHAHWLIPQGLIAAVLKKLSGKSIPYLVTSHGADLFTLRGRVFNAIKRTVIKKASAVTVVSEAMILELARIGSDVATVRVCPMGVDLSERFAPNNTVPRSQYEILFIGRFVEKKGLRHLIDAMPAILREYPSAHLTVVGFGPEDAERRAQVESLKLQSKIQFIGARAQHELPSLYQRAAIFVAPFVVASSGDQEGLGLVLVEAAGCGCPVVVSDMPAVRDVFDEETARLVAPGSAAAIARAVCASFGDGYSPQASKKVRELLYERFDWSVITGTYTETLINIIDGRQSKGC
jgi:glycosyltransferase involved in cell wall biosynthesis